MVDVSLIADNDIQQAFDNLLQDAGVSDDVRQTLTVPDDVLAHIRKRVQKWDGACSLSDIDEYIIPEYLESEWEPELGDTCICIEEQGYFCGQVKEDRICAGEVLTITSTERGSTDWSPVAPGTLGFAEHADRYGPWNKEHFMPVELRTAS